MPPILGGKPNVLTCKFLLVQICTLACGFVLCANLHVESGNFHVKMRICTELPTSYSRCRELILATSYFLLPTSYFLLPTSHFLLPTSYFLGANFGDATLDGAPFLMHTSVAVEAGSTLVLPQRPKPLSSLPTLLPPALLHLHPASLSSALKSPTFDSLCEVRR